MTDLDQVREIVTRTRREQGLDDHITDPITLARVAALLKLEDTP